MKFATWEQKLRIIKRMLELIRKAHVNHDTRNRRLAVVRTFIEYWLEHSSSNFAGDLNWQGKVDTLETIYHSLIWSMDRETHSAVKDRLTIVIEMCEDELTIASAGEKAKLSEVDF